MKKKQTLKKKPMHLRECIGIFTIKLIIFTNLPDFTLWLGVNLFFFLLLVCFNQFFHIVIELINAFA